jgi:hypothetical protein
MAQAKALLDALINATRVVALGPSEQRSAFPEFVVVSDEIALNYADAFLLVGQLLEEGLLNEEQARALGQVDEELRRMTEHGSEEVWTLEALHASREWDSLS